MTSADGTTFIIAYQYANDGDLDELTEAAARELTNKITQASPVEQPEEVGHQTQQPPLGNLGADVDREFLEGFLSGRECLPGGTGWWRYEICYGKHVIQFHVNKHFCFEILIKGFSYLKEEGQHRTSILLGKWNRDKHIAWLNKNPKKRPSGNIRDRQ
jgi:endoplasmic reticulum lectin 1